MSQHDDQVYLKHMLDHAREAVDILAGKSRDDLARDRILVAPEFFKNIFIPI